MRDHISVRKLRLKHASDAAQALDIRGWLFERMLSPVGTRLKRNAVAAKAFMSARMGLRLMPFTLFERGTQNKR